MTYPESILPEALPRRVPELVQAQRLELEEPQAVA